MFTPENRNDRIKTSTQNGGGRRTDVGGEANTLSILPSANLPFYSQQTCKAWLVRFQTGLYITIYCSFLYITHQKNITCYKFYNIPDYKTILFAVCQKNNKIE